MALNQITVQGRMTRDAEAKNTPSGKTVTVFCVAVQRNYKNAEGKYEADFIDCVAYDKLGEHIRKWFHKGEDILLTGELTTRTYDDKNGVKHKVATIITNKVFFSGANNGSNQQTTSQPQPAQQTQQVQSEAGGGNELPFEM